MRRALATVASIFALLAVPAAGQEGNPAFMTPDTGPKQPNNTDRVFVHAAALGGMTEVELGKLALKGGHKDAALVELRTAATLGDSDNDPMTAAEARRLMK